MKPILFNTEMVQAIVDGRKTVTRRIIKPQPKMRLSYCCMGHGARKWSYPSPTVCKYWGDEWRIPDSVTLDEEDRARLWTPPCHTDDILYVRETWNKVKRQSEKAWHYEYKADCEDPNFFSDGFMAEWRPSIHMPKEAARIFLRVKHVTIERLQDMTAQDSLDEGVKLSLDGLIRKGEPALAPFAKAWNKTIPRKDLPIYGWDANPWVWKVEFERISREEAYREDQM